MTIRPRERVRLQSHWLEGILRSMRPGPAAVIGVLLFGFGCAVSEEAALPGEPLPADSLEEPVLGVQLYSFRNQMREDVRGTLAAVREMGFSEVEAAGYQWESADQFRALLDEAGLKCISLFAGYEQLRDDFESVVGEAKTLGAHYVIVAWIPHGEEFSLEDLDRAVDHFNEWGRRLSQEGLRFAYHAHGYEFRSHEDGTLFDRLMAGTDPRHVALQMDVFWVVHPGQDPVELLRRYGDRVELMHLKDMAKGVQGDLTGRADVETNVTLGTGQIDFPAIVRAAREAGVRYLFIEDESSRVMEQVPQSLAYMTELLGRGR